MNKQEIINNLTVNFAAHLGDAIQVFDTYIYIELDSHYGDIKVRFPYDETKYQNYQELETAILFYIVDIISGTK